jgi:hypothetical protein
VRLVTSITDHDATDGYLLLSSELVVLNGDSFLSPEPGRFQLLAARFFRRSIRMFATVSLNDAAPVESALSGLLRLLYNLHTNQWL